MPPCIFHRTHFYTGEPDWPYAPHCGESVRKRLQISTSPRRWPQGYLLRRKHLQVRSCACRAGRFDLKMDEVEIFNGCMDLRWLLTLNLSSIYEEWVFMKRIPIHLVACPNCLICNFSGLSTTWAKKWCRTCSPFASPTWCSRTCETATACHRCKSPSRKISGPKAAAGTSTRTASSETSCKTTWCRFVRIQGSDRTFTLDTG